MTTTMSARDRADLHLRILSDTARSVPVPSRWPSRMRELHDGLRAAGWLTGVYQGEDSGGNVFLSMDAAHRPTERKAKAAWHSRATGGRSLRLFSCMLFAPWEGWRDVTVKALLAAAAGEGSS